MHNTREKMEQVSHSFYIYIMSNTFYLSKTFPLIVHLIKYLFLSHLWFEVSNSVTFHSFIRRPHQTYHSFIHNSQTCMNWCLARVQLVAIKSHSSVFVWQELGSRSSCTILYSICPLLVLSLFLSIHFHSSNFLLSFRFSFKSYDDSLIDRNESDFNHHVPD